ncbi:Protease HtpX [Bienertia sinuspersici]
MLEYNLFILTNTQILRAFGWIIPAVMVSSLIGTGSNSMIMALVLPLGQTALSLVMEKMWASPSTGPRPTSRPQTRPRSKSRSRSRPRPKRNPSHRHPMNSGYQSWGEANNGSAKKSKSSSSNYGGWDELDQQVASSNSFRKEQRQKVEALQKRSSEVSKLSRRINRDKPLFIRLLFAVFPFLGSWTRFLF